VWGPCFALGLSGCVVGLWSGAAAVDESRLPPAVERVVEYERDVRPILAEGCFRCHGAERPKSRFRLLEREAALAGGELGVAMIPGQSGRSPLIHYVAGLVPDLEMPPVGRGVPLTREQVGVLRAWIDQGASYGADAGTGRFTTLRASTALRWMSVSGNASRFRAQEWQSEGFAGGVQEFMWEEGLGGGRRFRAEGRLVGGDEDYRLQLSYAHEDIGFVRAGFEQFRPWSGDTGGAYGPWELEPFRLGGELDLDYGRAWIGAGFTAPDFPRMSVEYEYRYRDGLKSTLHWGAVYEPVSLSGKAVYPAFKEVDERVHVVSLDASHEVFGVQVADSFRGEFYETRLARETVDRFTLGSSVADSLTRAVEGYRHFQGANTLRLEKPVRDWLFLSGGYLYSNLDGEGQVRVETSFPWDPTLGPFVGGLSQQIVLRREAHVFNANAHLGPWQGLGLTAGVQADWTRQRGFGEADVFGFPSPYSADLDKFASDELLALRFTRIPYTVLYGEARFQQEAVGQFERKLVDDGFDDDRDFLRDTDATGELADYRVGFTHSPWQRLALAGSVRRRDRELEYRLLTDTDASGLPGNGYPAFLLGREVVTDEAEAKVVVHPARWLKTTLKYQVQATDYETRTAEGVEVFSGAAFAGGTWHAGDAEAQVYSLSTTLTPWRRLYVSGTFSVADSRLRTAVSNGSSVVPWAGDIYTVLGSATFAASASTDLQASYAFSRADFGQTEAQVDLPLGIVYERHGLTVGVTRRFKRNLTGSLQYGWYRYAEPTALGANDYRAHGVYAMLTKLWP